MDNGEVDVVDIVILDSKGNTVKEISIPDLSLYSLTWSPDGNEIVFEARDGVSTQIYTYNLETETVNQVTFEESNRWPDWSPTGGQILYGTYSPMASRTLNSSIFIMNSDGTGKRELIKDSWETGERPLCDWPLIVNELRYPTWSPYGRQIAFQVTENACDREVSKIYLVGMDGQKPRRLIEGNPGNDIYIQGYYYIDESDFVWSPDEKYIAFARWNPLNDDDQLCYANVDTSEWSCLGDESAEGFWGIDWCKVAHQE